MVCGFSEGGNDSAIYIQDKTMKEGIITNEITKPLLFRKFIGSTRLNLWKLVQ